MEKGPGPRKATKRFCKWDVIVFTFSLGICHDRVIYLQVSNMFPVNVYLVLAHLLVTQ